MGLGTEAPPQAEADQAIEQQKDALRKRGLQVPAPAETETPAASRRLRNALDAFAPSIRTVFDVRRGLRHPRRLSAHAIAAEAPAAVFYALRAARAAQRRRPRIAVGSALVVAGSVARLGAASVEPLQ